jgi:hypothetical protein
MEISLPVQNLLSSTVHIANQNNLIIDLPMIILSAIIGGVIGLLINYISDVLPHSRQLTKPTCNHCQQPLTLKEYLFQRKCPHCGSRRSLRFILVMLLSMACCVLLRFFPFANLGFWASLPILIFLELVVVIDIEHHLVLVQTSLVGLILFAIYGVILHGLSRTLFGALGGLLITLGFYLLGMVFTKFMGKLHNRDVSEVAFGFGDVFVGTFLGLLTGWPSIVGAIILAILIFGAYSLIFLLSLLLSKRYRAFANPQPFAPFLILGAILLAYL